MTKVLIAAAWPYASGPRHLGHLAGVYLPADVSARWHRLRGDDVLFVSGSDAYGSPITIAAEDRAVAVTAFVQEQHLAISSTFARLGISFDHYTITTSPAHHATVHAVFRTLLQRGFIDEVVAPAAYCPRHARAIPDRYVEGGCPHCGASGARGDQCDECGSLLDATELISPRCRRCGGLADVRTQRHLQLRLDRLQAALADYVELRLTTRAFARNETLGALEAGLRARTITRDLDWGVAVPLPQWDDRRLYVWFEAVIGYLSASQAAYPRTWSQWWRNPEARHRYFVGKDNVWFHTLWWPGILAGEGSGLHLPDDVVASHHLRVGGAQFSSSRGHGETVDSAADRLGVDGLRHALLALAPETADSDFTWEHASASTRTGLLGAIANPTHRVATLLWRQSIDNLCGTAGSFDQAHDALNHCAAALDGSRFREALSFVHDIGRSVNQELAATEPWRLPREDAARVLATVVPLISALSVAAWPFVPGTAERIRTTFGWPAVPERFAVDEDPARVPPRRPVAPFVGGGSGGQH